MQMEAHYMMRFCVTLAPYIIVPSMLLLPIECSNNPLTFDSACNSFFPRFMDSCHHRCGSWGNARFLSPGAGLYTEKKVSSEYILGVQTRLNKNSSCLLLKQETQAEGVRNPARG